MEFESVEALKRELFEDLIFRPGPTFRRGLGGARRRRVSGDFPALRIGLGVFLGERGDDHRLAVRVQDARLFDGPILREISSRARGEVDIRYMSVGAFEQAARSPPLPALALAIGDSVSHFSDGAGTIGLFPWASEAKDRRVLLSNHHVLVRSRHAVAGDAVVHPGVSSGLLRQRTAIGAVEKWSDIHFDRTNDVDAAVASIDPHIDRDPLLVRDAGVIRGLVPPPQLEVEVRKLGASTGLTKGRLISASVDQVEFKYEGGVVRFVNSLEIEGMGYFPFSWPGDSGAVILDRDNFAFGLLYGGATQVMHSGDTRKVTYANNLSTVFSRLNLPLDIV